LTRSLVIVLLLSAAVLTGAACGESEEEKAQNAVCDARADIQKRVDELSGLTVETATVNGVKEDLDAIGDDLQKIKDAQGDLNQERKQQVESANKTFASQVEAIVNDLGTDLSLSGAAAKLQSALEQLAASYKQTFAQVDCG
jgi:hypothetical protein